MMDLLIGQLWARRWTIALATVSCAVLAAIAAILMTNTYRASVVLAPRDHAEGLSGIRTDSAAAGLAALAGVSVSGSSRADEYFAFLNSQGLKLRFVEARELTRIFFPQDSLADGEPAPTASNGQARSAQDAVRKLDSGVLGISRDKTTGLITVTFDWSDPKLAAAWAEAFVAQANGELARRALDETDSRIAYLEDMAASVSQIEVQRAIYSLLESQLKSRMLATIGGDFAFKIIDPAIVADLNKPIRPRRVPMVFGGALLGGLLAVCWVVVLAGVSARMRSGKRESLAGE